ncbi:MAG: DinB family protein [Acidobacteria bacterium]|nr:DinB family protein [Acidobacteriota bacterium]
MRNTPPQAAEYAAYYVKYVSLVPPGDVVEHLARQAAATAALLGGVDEAKAAGRPAEDKWSLKEVLGHILDTERIMAYRALRIARNDATPLPSFEQDDYVRFGSFQDRAWSDLLEEYRTVRAATVSLLRGLSEEAWVRTGTASGNPVTVRALAWIIAGHELHHLNIVREKYLG